MQGIRVTFVFDPELYGALKKHAESEGRTMTYYVEAGVREVLGKAGKLPVGVVMGEAGRPGKRARRGKKQS